MARIALSHFRVGETDGVSLEMEKWAKVLKEQGHSICFLAGSNGTKDTYVIEELYYKHPENNKFVKNAYENLTDYQNEEEFKQNILNFAKSIEIKLIEFIEKQRIDVLVPNNIWSLGWNLPAAIGFANAVRKTGVKCVAHHHDFYWERERYAKPTCTFINDWLDEYFPPNYANISHVVINSIAQQELKERKGINSVVVPNVFDFSERPWSIDELNKDFRSRIGLNNSDLLILQATRIAKRKGIELAIDVIGELGSEENRRILTGKGLYNGRSFTEESRIVFVFAGMDESEPGYLDLLKEKADKLKVELIFINDLIASQRDLANVNKLYSLWDAYVFADLITYPSILEGWGNQFLEGAFAKKPIVVFEYPVFITDIKDKGFNIITLGDTYSLDEKGLVTVDHTIIKNAAKNCVNILTDNNLYNKSVDHNFEVGRNNYSYENLSILLNPVF